jgi:putative membrane protein
MILNYNKRLYYVSLAILIIIYMVGLIGLNTQYRDFIAPLTPYTLILSGVLILINHRDWNRYFAIFVVISAIAGYLVELIGVETGIIFGNYVYGDTLGYKLYDVPLIIGLNWFLLVYSCGMVANIFKFGIILKSFIGAMLMVIIDISIEPVAVSLDFWTWQDGVIPIQNYAGWLITAFFLHLYFQKLGLKKINRIAIALFIIQYIFFFVLSHTL